MNGPTQLKHVWRHCKNLSFYQQIIYQFTENNTLFDTAQNCPDCLKTVSPSRHLTVVLVSEKTLSEYNKVLTTPVTLTRDETSLQTRTRSHSHNHCSPHNQLQWKNKNKLRVKTRQFDSTREGFF